MAPSLCERVQLLWETFHCPSGKSKFKLFVNLYHTNKSNLGLVSRNCDPCNYWRIVPCDWNDHCDHWKKFNTVAIIGTPLCWGSDDHESEHKLAKFTSCRSHIKSTSLTLLATERTYGITFAITSQLFCRDHSNCGNYMETRLCYGAQ